jgi:hypothetical protein
MKELDSYFQSMEAIPNSLGAMELAAAFGVRGSGTMPREPAVAAALVTMAFFSSPRELWGIARKPGAAFDGVCWTDRLFKCVGTSRTAACLNRSTLGLYNEPRLFGVQAVV